MHVAGTPWPSPLTWPRTVDAAIAMGDHICGTGGSEASLSGALEHSAATASAAAAARWPWSGLVSSKQASIASAIASAELLAASDAQRWAAAPASSTVVMSMSEARAAVRRAPSTAETGAGASRARDSSTLSASSSVGARSAAMAVASRVG